MKKIIIAIIIIIFIFSVFGCIPAEEEEKEPETMDVEEDISGVDDIEKEFSLDELENLEKDLDIDW